MDNQYSYTIVNKVGDAGFDLTGHPYIIGANLQEKFSGTEQQEASKQEATGCLEAGTTPLRSCTAHSLVSAGSHTHFFLVRVL